MPATVTITCRFCRDPWRAGHVCQKKIWVCSSCDHVFDTVDDLIAHLETYVTRERESPERWNGSVAAVRKIVM